VRQRFGYLNPQSHFANIQRLRVNKLILAALVAPHDGDLVIARPPVSSAQIVAPLILQGFHDAYFNSTLDGNQVFTIEPSLCYSNALSTMQANIVDLEFGMLNKAAECCLMDVDVIRSRFIQDNLRSALQEPDKERAARTLRAFRNYFQWFESRVPDLERLTIVGQLANLEAAQVGERPEKPPPHPTGR
jgi:hypothetical protein